MTVRLRLLVFTFLLLLAGGPGVRAEEVKKEEKLALAQKVHDIFEAKCLDCHGPELPRPKGKFGYVLDLAKVAANPDYVIPGKPGDSEIYRMVLHDEMPGEDANVPPLTPEEKDVVKRWVEVGAPGELPAAAHDKAASTAAVPPSATTAKPPDPLWRHALRWLGQFHPLSTHFPVALMFVAAFTDLLSWVTKRDSWLQTIRFLVILAALGAVNGAVLGWLNANFSSYNKAAFALLWWHRWVGTVSAVWCVACLYPLLTKECWEGTRPRWHLRAWLYSGAAMIGLTGFLGSALIYGLNHYAW